MRCTIAALAIALMLSGCTSVSQTPAPTTAAQPTKLAIAGIEFNRDDIADAKVERDQIDRPAVLITFSESGIEKFRRAQSIGGVGHPMPITFDGKEISAPNLHEFIYGPNVQLSGNMTAQECQQLVDQLLGKR